jgi:hypothetical protein
VPFASKACFVLASMTHLWATVRGISLPATNQLSLCRRSACHGRSSQRSRHPGSALGCPGALSAMVGCLRSDSIDCSESCSFESHDHTDLCNSDLVWMCHAYLCKRFICVLAITLSAKEPRHLTQGVAARLSFTRITLGAPDAC